MPAKTLTGTLVETPAKPPAPIGNISYQQVKADASINAIIDSSQKLDNGNLPAKFHHASGKEPATEYLYD